MCFKEFLGYECGHCSTPVVRPCPLTTLQVKNPICTVQAQRQFLPRTFCPSCNRIIHGRHVMIQEAEHHFYHMRGACGCSVNFPRGTEPWMCGADEILLVQPDPAEVLKIEWQSPPHAGPSRAEHGELPLGGSGASNSTPGDAEISAMATTGTEDIQATATTATVGPSGLPPSRRPRRILHRLESVPIP